MQNIDQGSTRQRVCSHTLGTTKLDAESRIANQLHPIYLLVQLSFHVHTYMHLIIDSHMHTCTHVPPKRLSKQVPRTSRASSCRLSPAASEPDVAAWGAPMGSRLQGFFPRAEGLGALPQAPPKPGFEGLSTALGCCFEMEDRS